MRLLLDTHAFLWWLDDNPKLGERAREAIIDPTAVLIAQAKIEDLVIVTRDAAFQEYGVRMLSP